MKASFRKQAALLSNMKIFQFIHNLDFFNSNAVYINTTEKLPNSITSVTTNSIYSLKNLPIYLSNLSLEKNF